jgi:hypothetical protein
VLEAHGFTLFADPNDPAPSAGEHGTITPLLDLDMERETSDLRGFADQVARARMADVLEVADEWRPDLLVCDEFDFGAMVAAERIGPPHATVLTNASGSFASAETVAEPLEAIRADHGLPLDPGFRMPARDLVISPVPAELPRPGVPAPGERHLDTPGSRPRA